MGDVLLKNNQKISGHEIRFDLKNNLLEIKSDVDIKVCSLPLLKYFSYKGPTGDSLSYVNTSEVNNITFDLPKGICRILYQDKITIVSYQYMVIQKANYNEAMGVGNKDNIILKKERIYAIADDEVFEIFPSFKKNRKIFKDQNKNVEIYAKENKLKFRSEEDITKIFIYYNNIL